MLIGVNSYRVRRTKISESRLGAVDVTEPDLPTHYLSQSNYHKHP